MLLSQLGNQTRNNGFQNQLVGGGFGSYEEKKKRLAEERKKEYQLFLQKKNEEEEKRKENRLRQRQEVQQKQEMDYREMLRRKKEEEMRYRDVNDFGAVDYGSSTVNNYAQLNKSENQLDSAPNESPFANNDRRTMSQRRGGNANTYLSPSPGQFENPDGGDRRRSRVYSAIPNLAPSNNHNTNGSPQTESYSPSFTEKEVKKRPQALPDNRPPFMDESTSNHKAYQQVQIQVAPPAPHTNGASTTTLQQEPGWLGPKDDSVTRSTQGSNNPKAATQYRDELQKQIEEKKRRQEEAKRKEREEEEKLAKRIEEQRLKMQKEYEEEVAAKKKKEEEAQKKHELLLQKQREMQLDADNDRKRARQNYYNKRTAEEPDTKFETIGALSRQRSPPIPTLRKAAVAEVNTRSNSPPIPTLRNKEMARSQSPPIPTMINKSKVADKTDVNPSTTRKPNTDKQNLQKIPSLETPPPEIVDEITQFRQQLLNEDKQELETQKLLQQSTYRVTSSHFVVVEDPKTFPLLAASNLNATNNHVTTSIPQKETNAIVAKSEKAKLDRLGDTSAIIPLSNLPRGDNDSVSRQQPEVKLTAVKRDMSCQVSSPKQPK